ncbi:MAG: phytanoyl-CoA dioxygenase family protein [Candidatus Poribacteria bacterium]|nr:phytanoyl-CoA dioxygenase family protein [Candidatus Poribacteria bacterium]
MTPEELYRYDVNGYLLIENAIEPDYLDGLNERLDIWEEKALQDFRALPQTANPEVRYDDILNQEPSLLPLVVNPKVLPYIDEMVSRPRLKSTWLTFKWNGGRTTFHSNHTPSVTHDFYHFNGRIHHNLFQVFYAMRDIGPGEGGLKVIPGSHKANYPPPPDETLEDMHVEIPMKAGSVLLFTHDMRHGSLNTSDKVRRTIIFTYCPGVIANSFGGDTLYQRLFEEAPEGSWMKYLLRQPHGFLEVYPKPEGRVYTEG